MAAEPVPAPESWGRRILTACSPMPADPPRVLARKIELLHARLPTGLVMATLVTVFLVVFMPVQGGRAPLLAWGAISLAVCSLRMADCLVSPRRPRDLGRVRRGWAYSMAGAVAQGLLWGGLGWFLFPPEPVAQFFLLLVLTGMAGGGIAFLPLLNAAYSFFAVAILVPICLRLLTEPLPLQKGVGAMGLLYLLALLLASAKTSRWINDALGAAFEREELVARLQASRDGLEEQKAHLKRVVAGRTRSLSDVVARLREGLRERTQAEDDLRAALVFNGQIIASAHQGIVVYDPQGRYRLWNPFMEALTGVAAGSVLGRRPDEVLSFPAIAAVMDGVGRALQGQSVTLSPFPWVIDATGRSGWASSILAPLRDGGGGVTGVVETVTDLTEWKRVEQRQRDLEAELHHAQKLESIGSLAGGVAHDMNNVLAAVQAIVQTLRDKHPDEPGLQADLGLIERASTRGRDLVRGLTHFVRKGLEEPEHLDLNALVREEMELLGHTTLQRVTLDVDLAEALPLVLGEHGALGGALMNLCVNALDAMSGRGTLTLRTRRLGDGQVQLLVEDTGKGMPPGVLARAMEPFFTTKEAGKGTGLGLASVYATVKAHGGTLALRSAEGRGTTVEIRLPAAAPAPVPAVPAGDPAPAPGALRILQVDDDDLILATVPRMLEQRGHRVATAESGREALERLRAGLEVDVVILDLNMPGMNGLETLERIRAIRPELPVLLATGFLEPGAEERLRHCGRAMSITKPFSMAELGGALGKVARPES